MSFIIDVLVSNRVVRFHAGVQPTTMGQIIRFKLMLSPERYLKYYQGMARNISVVAEDGRRVEFPANSLRPFVTRDGIRGRFELQLDDDHRLVRIERL